MKSKISNKIFIAVLTFIFLINITACTKDSNITSVATKIFKVHYIDVGQADSILVQSNGSNMLIDAGNRDDDTTVINYLKNQGVKKLDIVIGTHPHEDHIGGMAAVLKAYKVDKIIMPRATTNTKTFQNLLTTIKSKGLKVTSPIPGTNFKLGDATCNILAPNSNRYDNLNNYSVVIRIVYGKNSFMFDGDAEAESEQEIINKGYAVETDVLKLGHHGSRTSSSNAFLNKVKPKYAIISCGKGNDYGHPHDVTIKKLLKKNITFYRTDVNGSITCTSNGSKISFTMTGSSIPNNTTTPDSPNGIKGDGGGGGGGGGVKSTSDKKGVTNKNNSKITSSADTIVYITKTGKAYHTVNCTSFKKSKISITLGEAIKKGYKPHKGCNAPILK